MRPIKKTGNARNLDHSHPPVNIRPHHHKQRHRIESRAMAATSHANRGKKSSFRQAAPGNSSIALRPEAAVHCGMYRDYKFCGKVQNTIRSLRCTTGNDVIDSSLENNKTVINYDEVKNWSVSFNRLMQNVIGRNMLKQYLTQEHAEEGLLFWEEVEQFKKLRRDDEIQAMAQEIYTHYICDNATSQISIGSKCMANLAKSIKQPSHCMFDDAQQHIVKSLETDNYERFKRSKLYVSFLLRQIPHDVVIEWGQNFDKLLQHEEGKHLLEEFLVKEKADENLRFWKEVQDYKKCPNSRQRKARANDIYNRFVNPDAKTEISIDGPTKTSIMKSYEKGEPKLFDAAEEHIYVLMKRDCYPRFVKSKCYLDFLEMHEKNNENREETNDTPGEQQQ